VTETREMVHIPGDNGPGWMVPKPKAWQEMTEHEQLDRVLSHCGVSCPGWCTEHFEATPRFNGSVVVHTWDLITEGPFTVGLEQDDWISYPDGYLVQRDPAEIHIRLDDTEPEIQAAIAVHTVEADEYDRFVLDADEAAELAEKLRGEPHDWAPRLAEALATLADAIPQPRRPSGVTFIYGQGAD